MEKEHRCEAMGSRMTDDDLNAAGFPEHWTCLNPGNAVYAIDNDHEAEFAAYWNRRFKYPWESNPWCWTAWVEEEHHA